MNFFVLFLQIHKNEGNKPEWKSREHLQVQLHAGGISVGLINTVSCSFWIHDGKPLSGKNVRQKSLVNEFQFS